MIRHRRMHNVDTLSISKVKYNVKICSLFLSLAYSVNFCRFSTLYQKKSNIDTMPNRFNIILSYALHKSFIFLILQKDNIICTSFHQMHFVMVQFFNSLHTIKLISRQPNILLRSSPVSLIRCSW